VTLPPPTDPQWRSTKNALLAFSTPVGLATLLWTNRDKVAYRHPGVVRRLVGVAAYALANACFGVVDAIVHGRAIAREPLPDDPVFVLGLPRSGTTLLHQLLAADPQFLAPDTFQVFHPTSFLTARPWRERLLAPHVQRRRLVDNVAQTLTGMCT